MEQILRTQRKTESKPKEGLKMTTQKTARRTEIRKNEKSHPAMKTPAIVSPEVWETARRQMLGKEEAFIRSRHMRSFYHA
jgi:hypothetical protein